MKAKHYFECHITIEPIFDDELVLASKIADMCDFKIANLLMQKREMDIPERSKYDTFMTAHRVEYHKLVDKMKRLIHNLKIAGYKVYRYKIEDIVLDSKLDDEMGLL